MNMTVGTDGGVWVPVLDKDFDPIYGDLGKVDLGGVDKADNFAGRRFRTSLLRR